MRLLLSRSGRKRALPRLLAGALAIALFTTIAVAAMAIGQVSTIAADISLHQVRSTYLKVPKPGAPQTILVLGNAHQWDANCDGGVGCYLLHADTFMLVRMDPNQGQTSVMSIPRDLLVNFTWDGQTYTDQKFNSTYSIGGDQLVLKVAHQLLPGLAINDFIDINFDSFIGVVQSLGCVYVDVDHRYYNAGDDAYQPINLEPGYQKLCGEDALEYVRYRHTDSDFVRVARQQDFIRQAKEQLGLFNLVFKVDQIAKAFGQAIKTNIHGVGEVNALLNLVLFSQSKPIRQVPFQYLNSDTWIGGEEYVSSSPQKIQASIHDFLDEDQLAPKPAAPPPTQSSGSHHHQHHHRAAAPNTSYLAGMGPLSDGVLQQAQQMAVGVSFPVMLPSSQALIAMPNDFHRYKIADESGNIYSGYRIDWFDGQAGLYYGIEGMDWTDPPLFENPTWTEKIGSRTYMFIDDGAHYHDIGWIQGHDLYWVSNTLLESLSNSQMLALAESAHPIS